MTQFEVTPALRAAVGTALGDRDTVSHRELIRLYKEAAPGALFASWLKCTRPARPAAAAAVPKTREYLASVERLTRQREEEEYRRMVNMDIGLYDHDASTTPASMAKELRSQLTTIVNVLVLVALVVYAVWHWTRLLWGLSNGLRVLCCLFFGVLVLVAEVVVFSGYLLRVEDARKRERAKREVKLLKLE